MNQSVIKALKILDLFNEEYSELSLKEIAERSGLSKPTAFRMIQSLETMGFLMKSEGSNHKYRLGLKLLTLGQLVLHELDLRQLAKPLMKKLAHTINEAVHLVVLNGEQATYIEKVDSPRALRLFTKVGKSVPLYIGSGPKLLLAYMSEKEQQQVVEKQDLFSMVEEKPVDKENLLSELYTIRSDGYSISIGEQDMDTTGLSYPIFDHSGHVIAALTVSGLSSHFEGNRLEFIKNSTMNIAVEISKCLGFSTYEKEVKPL